MACPTFKMHGSKARITKWVLSNFPISFNRYIEPFAGRGNVFYRLAYNNLPMMPVLLNDLHTYKWLKAIKEYDGDWEFLPKGPVLDRESFEKFRDMEDCIERVLAEPIVCFQGGSFLAKGSNTSGPLNANKYSFLNTVKRYNEAQRLLRYYDVILANFSYEDLLKRFKTQEGDFFYFDPPYFGTEVKIYDNIDHELFCEYVLALDSLGCYVCISGYNNYIYQSMLKDFNVETLTRSSVARKNKDRVLEHIWKNY